MAGRFVRDSKLRNVYGQPFKKDKCFDSIRVSKNNNTQMFCAVNPKFMAVVTHAAGGGSFLVLPHDKTGRLDINYPQIAGHQAPVIDIAWSPFDDNMIASSDDKGCIMIWEIPDGGLTEPLMEPLLCLDNHQKRCTLLKWHPTASNVLLSCGVDLMLYVWNLYDGIAMLTVTCPDIVQDMCWSLDGKTFVTASKDKKIRIFDGRNGEVVKELPGHAAPKDMRVCLLKDNRLLSTGFTRDSRREYKIWNLDDLSGPMYEDTLDVTNAPLNIFYDPDVALVYLVGKGDSVIRYYEVNNDEPYFHYIATHQSSMPQRGMGFMPKRGCNVNGCEVARMYKVMVSGSSVGSVEPISMIVPRKSELFQGDIFPDTAANVRSVSAEEWFNGKDGSPKVMSMKQFFVEKDAAAPTGLGGLKKSGLKKSTTPAAVSIAPAKTQEAAKPTPTSSVKAPAAKASTPASNHSHTEDDENEEETVPEAKPEPKAAPPPKALEPKPEPKPEPKTEPKAEKKPESSTPPASTPSEPLAPKAPVPKAQDKEPSAKTKKQDATPKEPTTPKGGENNIPVLDGKLSVKDVLLDVRNLRNTVSRHEASISALEELEANQSQEIQDLIAEITKLKATVAEQEMRISALEAK